MAFTDDFSGLTDGDNLDVSASWTANETTNLRRLITKQSSAGTDYIVLDALGGSTDVNWYYCPDQGDADCYVQGRLYGFTTQTSWLCALRIDGANDNCVGWWLAGTGASGLRMVKSVSGSETNLESHQGVSDSWYKVEASGDQYSLWSGGSGATPGTWSQLGSDQTVTNAEVPTTTTNIGFRRISTPYNINFLQNFEAGALAAAGVGVDNLILQTGGDNLLLQSGTTDVLLLQSSTSLEVTTNLETLTLTEQQASVALDANVDAGPASLTLTEQQAAVALDANVDAGPATLTLTEHQASISLDANVDAGPATLTLTEQTASIDLSGALNVPANVATLTLTEQPATITLDCNVTTNVATLTLTELSASIASDDNVSANTASLTLTELQASVSLDANVDASTTALTLTPIAAAISLDCNVATNTAALTLTELQANIGTGSWVAAKINGVTIP